MRLLVLPGFLQSGKTLAEKLSGFRKLMKKSGHELDFVDPPKEIILKEDVGFPIDDEKFQQLVETGNNRCWWFHQPPKEYEGYQELFDWCVEYIEAHGPYDGIVGFSQGAGMALTLIEKYEFKLAVLFSGFLLKPHQYGPVKTKTVFNIYGNNDQVVKKELSQAIGTVCPVEEFEFEGGHMMPNKKPFLLPLIEKINALA